MLRLSTKKDKVVAIRQMVNILCILYFDSVTDRELDFLCEVVTYGEVSRISKSSFQISYKTTKENTAQIITRLTNKGILVDKPYKTGKEVHPYFKDIIDIVKSKEKNGIVVVYDAEE